MTYYLDDIAKAMEKKDSDLYRSLSCLHVAEAAERWREVYEEDFPNLNIPIISMPLEYWVKPRDANPSNTNG